MSERAEKAVKLFENGYNCCQAVFCAFADSFDLDAETALKLSSGFGGGIGRLREVCGAFSACVMLAGLNEDKNAKDPMSKTAVYKAVREQAEHFKAENGSIVCRELLGLSGKSESHVPEERTEGYYKKRPCKEIVRTAAEMMDAYLNT